MNHFVCDCHKSHIRLTVNSALGLSQGGFVILQWGSCVGLSRSGPGLELAGASGEPEHFYLHCNDFEHWPDWSPVSSGAGSPLASMFDRTFTAF